MNRCLVSFLAFLSCTGIAYSQPASDEKWPTRPVTLVVTFPAGSNTDFVARILARGLNNRLGVPFVIENRPGGVGAIGGRQVATAKPDGYTFGIGGQTVYVPHPSVQATIGYAPDKDLISIALLSRAPYLFAVNPSLPAKSISELIALAKSKPGKLNYSSAGAGSTAHVGMVVFSKMTGVEMAHISYKSTAQSIVDVASGVIDLQLATIAPALPLYVDKKVRVIAVTDRKRFELMPEVPTAHESGLPDFELSVWTAMFAPAGTPARIIDRLSHEINEILSAPESQKLFAQQGLTFEPGTPTAATAFIRKKNQAYVEIIREIPELQQR